MQWLKSPCKYTVSDVSVWLNSDGFEDFSEKFQGMFIFYVCFEYIVYGFYMPLRRLNFCKSFNFWPRVNAYFRPGIDEGVDGES